MTNSRIPGCRRISPCGQKTGLYRGVLEVSQDVTGIRSLEGQRRLLQWDLP